MGDGTVALPTGVPRLNTFYVYLTSGCNLACQHCWLSPAYQPDGGTGGHLEYDLFAQAIEEGLPLGLRSVKLTGGEPLLHPDFASIIDLLRQKELGLTIETNGTLLSRELAFYLKEHSTLGHISVSLDGAKAETHDPFRGVKGSFDRAVQGVRWLVEAGFHPQVIMSLHPGNVDEIETLVRLAESLGAGSVKFNLIQPTGRGETLTKRGRVLDIEQLIELGRWVESDLQKRTNLSLHYSWPMAFHSLKRLARDGRDSCGIFGILGLLASGHYAMCGIGVQIPELTYGRIGQDALAEVWCQNPMLANCARACRPDWKGCVRSVYSRCSAWAVVWQRTITRSRQLTAAYWFCEQAEKEGCSGWAS